MKAQDSENFPAIRLKAKFFEPRQIWYQNAYPPNSIWISKIIGFLGKHPCLTRYCAFSLLDSPEIARIFFVNKPESVLELSITLPIPAKHSLTYLNKAAEENSSRIETAGPARRYILSVVSEKRCQLTKPHYGHLKHQITVQTWTTTWTHSLIRT